MKKKLRFIKQFIRISRKVKLGIRKNICKYSIYFSGREGNAKDTEADTKLRYNREDQGTHNEEAGKRSERRIPIIQRGTNQQENPKPKTKKFMTLKKPAPTPTPTSTPTPTQKERLTERKDSTEEQLTKRRDSTEEQPTTKKGSTEEQISAQASNIPSQSTCCVDGHKSASI